MTIFAGIYAINNNYEIVENLKFKLKRLIGREETEHVTGSLSYEFAPFHKRGRQAISEIYSSRRFFLVKLDIGAYMESGVNIEGNSVATVAGDPLFALDNLENSSRLLQLERLTRELGSDNIDILTSCNGSFSLCYYNTLSHTLLLATDQLGLRPVYYYTNPNFVYFASCFRIINGLPDLPKKLDINAVIEKKVFGVPLGTNTPLFDVKVLRDGQYLKCKGRQPEVSYYFRWGQISFSGDNEKTALRKSYDMFKYAVEVRSRREEAALSHLSGGLDSRCIVSMLHLIGKKVFAYNFSMPGDQDEVFGGLFAKRLGIKYFSTSRNVIQHYNISELINMLDGETKASINFPKLIFSGDGGSVGVGHVYLDEAMVRLLRENRIDDALRLFLKKRNFPKRVINKKLLDKIENLPFSHLKEEMKDLSEVDPGRKLYLFLLRNDQRRHLHGFYEDIDLYDIEYQLPFYDFRFLKAIISSPIEPFLRHTFYHKWLELFPGTSRSVPWQTYPGHAICPIPHPKELPTQWKAPKNSVEEKRLLRECARSLGRNDFPKSLLSKKMILLAIILHLLKYDDYTYIFNFCRELNQDYSGCSDFGI